MPNSVQSRSHFSAISTTESIFGGSTTRSIRSWDSESAISHPCISVSRWGTLSRSRIIPTPLLEATSLEEESTPAAPMSCMLAMSFRSRSSRQHSIRRFSVKGSPICTWGRLCRVSSLSSTDAKAAPAMPSRPVFAPRRRTFCPGLAV